MALGGGAGFVSVPVVPTFKGMSKEFVERLEKPAKKAGESAGKAIEKGLGASVANLNKQMAASGDKLKQYDREYTRSTQKKETQQKRLNAAILDQAAAEEKYQEALAKGKSGTAELARVERAKSKVAAETVKLAGAEDKVRDAEEKHARQLDDLRSTSDRYESELNELSAQTGKTTKELRAMGDEVASLDDDFDASGAKVDGFGSKMKNMLGFAGKMGGFAAGLAGISGAAATLQAGFDKITSIEDTTASLEILMGSADEARHFMDALQESNQKTPYSFDSWAGAGKQLVAFGIEAEQANRSVQALGEAAAASGKGEDALNNMSQAMGQAAAAGVMSMDTINRLSDGGVQGLTILANHFDVTTDEMKKMISSGAVPAEEGIKALTDGIIDGSEGAAGAVESMSGVMGEMSETTSGRLTNLKAAFNNLAGEIFESINPLIGDLAAGATDWVYRLKDALEQKVIPAIKRTIESVKAMVDWFQRNKDWILPTAAALGVLAAAYAALVMQQKIMMAGGLIKWFTQLTKVQQIHAKWTAICEGVQKAFNLVMNANPIFLVVTAIAALVAGLVVFFTKTETGRKLWEKFSGALVEKWTWVVDKFKAGVQWIKDVFGGLMALWRDGDFTGALGKALGIEEDSWFVGAVLKIRDVVVNAFEWIKNAVQVAGQAIGAVFGWIWEVVQVTIGVIGTVVLAPLMIAWNLLATGIQVAWESLIRPTIDALGEAFTLLWENVLSPVIDWIREKWDDLCTGIQVLWEEYGRPAIDAIGEAFTWLWENVLQPVFDAIRGAWDLLLQGLKAAWENILKPVLDAIGSALQWLWNTIVKPILNLIWGLVQNVFQGICVVWESVLRPVITAVGDALMGLWTNVVQPVLGWIQDRWQQMGDALHAVWTWVRDNVFAAMQRGLEVVKDAFGRAVEGIRTLWDKVRAAAAKPIKFVIETVFNKGIVAAWNKVAGWVGLDKVQEYRPSWLGGFARGGVLPGYTPGRDPYEFIEPRTGMRIGLSGGEAVIRPEATRVLGPDWVDGVNAAARVGGAQGVQRYLGGFAGGGVIGSITGLVNKHFPGMTITSTLRPGDPGHHGSGNAVDFSDGTDSTPGMRRAAQWFYANYGKGLYELIHSPFNNNVKNGQNVGDGFGLYGAGTMNGHRNHVHVASPQPLGDPKTMVEMVWDGAVAFVKSLRERVVESIAGVLDPIEKAIPEFPGMIGKVPRATFGKLKERIVDFLSKRADEFQPAGGAAGNAESWREMAMAAMRRQGFNADDPAQVNAMLAQIMSESGGDPGVAQQIVDVNGTGESAGVGLLQIIPGTFAAHRDPSLPDDRRDPWANMNAALRYYKSRYGNDLTVMWGHGHGYAAGGVIPSLASLLPHGVYDTGGVLPHGATALNLSGRPEVVINGPQLQAINSLATNVGALVGQLAATGDVDAFVAGLEKTVGPEVAAIAEQVTTLADPESVAGVAARTAAREVAEIAETLGAEYLPKTVTVLLDAEKSLYDAREKHAERVSGLEEKTTALTEAQKRLADLQNGTVEESTESAEKLAEAEKQLEDARADGDTDKVEEAEKNLAEVRKSSAEDAEKAEQERADNIEKATEDVKKAEADLADARREHARNLDMTVYEVMPGLYDGLMQAAAGAGQFSGQVAAVAAAVGPAGMSIGMMVETAKTVINVVKSLVEMILDIVERVFQARLEARKGLADAMATVAEYAKLLADLQADVSKLQQEVVRGVNEQRTAMFNLRVAIHDRLVAEAEGYVAVTEARLKLDAELERGARIAQLKMMGLHEDWDTYLSYRAQVAGDALAVWSDAAITALYQYEAARATALKGELSARLKQIEAEAALAEATRKNARNQADLLTMQERLIRMSAQVAGVDLPGAVGGKQASSLLVELFELERAMKKNVFGRWGYQLGDDSSYAMAYKGQVERKRSIEAALAAVLDEAGVSISESTKQAMFKRMEKVAWRKGDVADVVRAYLPEVAKAEAALKMHDSLSPIWDAQDKMRDQEREVEDFRAEMDLFEKTHPLEETIKGLEYAIAGLTSTADAFGEESEEMRAARLRLARANLTAASHHGVDWKVDDRFEGGARVVKEVTVHMDGAHVYTADEVDKLLAEVTSGSNVAVRTSWSASTVAGARRKERV